MNGRLNTVSWQEIRMIVFKVNHRWMSLRIFDNQTSVMSPFHLYSMCLNKHSVGGEGPYYFFKHCEISRSPVDSCSRSSCRSPGPGHVSPHLSLYRSSSPLSMCGLQEEDPELDTRLVSATLQQPALTLPLVHSGDVKIGHYQAVL